MSDLANCSFATFKDEGIHSLPEVKRSFYEFVSTLYVSFSQKLTHTEIKYHRKYIYCLLALLKTTSTQRKVLANTVNPVKDFLSNLPSIATY